MLSSIPWGTYWMFIAGVLVIYYLYVAIAYFRSEIADVFQGGGSKKPKFSTRPLASKTAVLGSFGSGGAIKQEQLQEQKEQVEEKLKRKPAPISNAQYATTSNSLYEETLKHAKPVNPEIIESTVQPFSDSNIQLEDIALSESNIGEYNIVSSIPLWTEPHTVHESKIIDVEMFLSFIENYRLTPEESIEACHQHDSQELEAQIVSRQHHFETEIDPDSDLVAPDSIQQFPESDRQDSDSDQKEPYSDQLLGEHFHDHTFNSR